MIARSWEFLLNFSFAMRCLEIVEIFGARFEAKRNWIIGPQSSEVVMHFRLQVFLSHESHEGRVLKARFMADAKRQEQFSNVMDASSKAVNCLGDDHKKVHGHGAKLCNVGMSRDLTTMKNCFFPTLKSIHLHGTQGILTHLAQAEKTKQPRPQMTCFVFCDGMKGLFPRRGSTQKPQLFFFGATGT